MEGPVGIASPSSTWTLDAAYAYATQRAIPPSDPDGEPLYNCPFPPCSKQFSKRFNLKAHLRVHTGDKPFVCSFPGCTRRFMWKSSLTSHQTGHSRRKLELQKRNAVLAGKALAAESVHTASNTPLRAAPQSFAEGGPHSKRVDHPNQHQSIVTNPQNSAVTTQMQHARQSVDRGMTHPLRLPDPCQVTPPRPSPLRHQQIASSSSHPNQLQPPHSQAFPPSNQSTDTPNPTTTSHSARMYSSIDCSTTHPRLQSSVSQPTRHSNPRQNQPPSDPSSMSYITAEYPPGDSATPSNHSTANPLQNPMPQPGLNQANPTNRRLIPHPPSSHPLPVPSDQHRYAPHYSYPMQLQTPAQSSVPQQSTQFRGSSTIQNARRSPSTFASHPGQQGTPQSGLSPFHYASPASMAPHHSQQPAHAVQTHLHRSSGLPVPAGPGVRTVIHVPPSHEQKNRMNDERQTHPGQDTCPAGNGQQKVAQSIGIAKQESLVTHRSPLRNSGPFSPDQPSGIFGIVQKSREKSEPSQRGEGKDEDVQQLEHERLLEEQRLTLRRQEEQIKEQRRIIREQEQKQQAQHRQLLRLQQEREEMSRQEIEERQRRLPQGRQDEKPPFGDQKRLRGAQPITEQQADLQMTLPKLEDSSKRFQQMPIPSLPSPVQAGAVQGAGQENDRLGKRDLPGATKSTQPSLMSPASLGLGTSSILPSPSAPFGIRSPNGFHQQFLFPSNGSTSWGGNTPTVPGVTSMLMNSPKPPHTPGSQMDVQMANPGLESHPGDVSPGPSEIAISPGIVTSPVPPPILPEVSSTYRPRHAMNRSKPPLGGPILPSGSSHTLSRLANVAPANPPTHIDLKGLPEDEASCSFPALGSPHTELSPLPVASPIFGNGQTPVSPIQPYSPFSGLNSSSAKMKQTTTW